MLLEKINDSIKIKKLTSVVYIACIICFFLFFVRRGFISLETNDDAFLAIIPSGWFGDYYPYTIHNNILIGYIIASITRVLPLHNWTTLFYLGLIITSYNLIGLVIIQKEGAIIGSSLSAIFCITTWLTLVNRMNYSKTGGVAIIVGCMALVYSLDNEWKKKEAFALGICGMGLLFIGALIRYKTCIAVVPYIIVFLCFLFMRVKKNSLRRIIPFAVVILVILFSWLFDFWIYHTDDEWRKFKEYNDVREQLMDYDVPTYQENEDEYKRLGLNENDYKMLITWQYADEEVFGIDTLKALLQYREERYPKELSISKIKKILELVIIGASAYQQIYVVLFVFIVCILTTRENKAYIWITVLLMLGELCYLRFVVRFLERAVMIPVIVALIMVMFFYKPDYQRIGLTTGLLVMIVIYSYFACGLDSTNNWQKSQVSMKDEVNKLYNELSENENNLYVWHIYTAYGNLDGSHDRFDSYAFGQHRNSVYSGGWPVPSPIMASISEKFGEKNNVFKLLAYNRNVYYVDYTDNPIDDIGIEMVEKYIQDHYDKDAKASLVKETGSFSIYSFCTQ